MKALVLRRSNLDAWRVSYELAVSVALLVLTVRLRGAAALRWALGGLYVLLLLFVLYHHAFSFTFEVAPAV